MHCVKNRKYLRYFKRNPRNIVNNCANIYTQKTTIILHCTKNRKYLRYFEQNPRNIVNICANIYGIFNGFERGLLYAAPGRWPCRCSSTSTSPNLVEREAQPVGMERLGFLPSGLLFRCPQG